VYTRTSATRGGEKEGKEKIVASYNLAARQEGKEGEGGEEGGERDRTPLVCFIIIPFFAGEKIGKEKEGGRKGVFAGVIRSSLPFLESPSFHRKGGGPFSILLYR